MYASLIPWLRASGGRAHSIHRPKPRPSGLIATEVRPMTVDRYTKAVLTVIAGCLLWICAASAGVPLFAQRDQPAREAGPWSDRAQPVVIVGTGTMDDQGRVTINLVEHQ